MYLEKLERLIIWNKEVLLRKLCMHLVLEKLAKKKEPNLNKGHKKKAYMREDRGQPKQQLKSPLIWVLDIAKECWVTSFIMKATSSCYFAKF